MDGTGLLFQEMTKVLPHDLDIVVISLDELADLTYAKQAQEIAEQLGSQKVFLVAESYSGPISYALCSLLGNRVRGLVFIASFISSPSTLSKLAFLFPVSLLKPNRINKWLLNKIGFSGFGNDTIIQQVFYAVSLADNRKLKRRLKNIATIKMGTQSYNLPTTYIRPTKDLLVKYNACQDIRKLFSNTTIIEIQGGHFIAQSHPVQCANIIKYAIDDRETL